MEDEEKINEIIFKYQSIDESRERLPIIKLRIVTPHNEYPNGWVDAILDTGYDGGLLIPMELYKKAELQKSELPVEQWDVGESLTGGMTLLQAALANIKIQGLDNKFELRIETFQGNQEVVLGLNGIKDLILCLLGPEQSLKIISSQF